MIRVLFLQHDHPGLSASWPLLAATQQTSILPLRNAFGGPPHDRFRAMDRAECLGIFGPLESGIRQTISQSSGRLMGPGMVSPDAGVTGSAWFILLFRRL
ncbi:hypothetical protein LL253_13650 [Sphingobium soli]|uniref:Uncharacterized protein n=1 Tax=Sphingobium soli TaxID=1591116 RepID=A0ABS8H5B1_9SPHN|nr:hypothetical protein [Sphingobium soli]MCC4233727.1 hypothetical protein [Sphingobium soli]